MTIRRPAAGVLLLALLCLSCGLAPIPDEGATGAAAESTSRAAVGDSLRSVSLVATTMPPTTTIVATTTVARTADVRSTGMPDHLRSSGDGRVEWAAVAVLVASGIPVSPPTTTAPVVADVVSTTTVAPATTTVPAAPTTTAPAATVPTTTVPPAPTTTTSPPVADGSTAGQFAARINGLRADVGAGVLARSGDLDARAQAWADYMASNDDFRHSTIINDLVAGAWSIAGENLGYGPSVDAVFGGLTASSGHYDNMVNTRFTTMGIGVVVDGNGVIWTAHLFAG